MARPSEYKPEYAEIAAKLCTKGFTDVELAETFGVSVRTIYRWKEFDDFCQALKVGKEPADNRVERALYERATGYSFIEQQAIKIKIGQYEERVEIVDVERQMPPDTTACIFWLKNRRKEDWREKVDGPDDGDETPSPVKVTFQIVDASTEHSAG
jgi:hypothetical protein